MRNVGRVVAWAMWTAGAAIVPEAEPIAAMLRGVTIKPNRKTGLKHRCGNRGEMKSRVMGFKILMRVVKACSAEPSLQVS